MKAGVEGRRLLGTSTDWQMRVDQRKRMEFPPEVAVTNKRPDTVIWSATTTTTTTTTTKQPILLEKTVPWENRIEIAKERKSMTYQKIVIVCQQSG